jgi:site-specific DNA recombinase
VKGPSVKAVRCAIYTRVSTDQGLDQEFNSLDAQYEASSAYIKSQAHAGWTMIRSRYDDGGYSGGSTDRPDLQRLLDNIRTRKIDVIVAYKVDRLTSSLADFAKLVELFDAHGVSFISVTEAFNARPDNVRLGQAATGEGNLRDWMDTDRGYHVTEEVAGLGPIRTDADRFYLQEPDNAR